MNGPDIKFQVSSLSAGPVRAGPGQISPFWHALTSWPVTSVLVGILTCSQALRTAEMIPIRIISAKFDLSTL